MSPNVLSSNVPIRLVVATAPGGRPVRLVLEVCRGGWVGGWVDWVSWVGGWVGGWVGESDNVPMANTFQCFLTSPRMVSQAASMVS